MKTFIISYDGIPLVIVTNHEYKLPTDILDWYSEKYAFERNKLSYSMVDTVAAPIFGLPSTHPAYGD